MAALVTVNKLSASIPSILHLLTVTYSSSSRRAFKGSGILQNLLAIPLRYCSSDSTSNIDLSESDSISQIQPFTESVRHGPNISLANSEHNLVVGKWTVLIYAGLGGLAIIFCLIALTLATFHRRAASLPNATIFPLYNFWRWNADKGDVDPRAADRWSRDQRVFCTRV